LSETDVEYGDILCHTEVQWMSHGAVLKHALAFRLKTEIFMNLKGEPEAALSDEKWFWDLALLCDISHH
jgi:hypothetical protein